MATLFFANGPDEIASNMKDDGWSWGYNSTLLLATDAGQNHELKLYLGLCLQKVPKAVGDALHKPNIRLQDWEDADWYKYQSSVTQGANVWNNRFWLIPPESYKELSWPLGHNGFAAPETAYRFNPNIKCSLEVNFFENPGDAHKTINVVRLADSYAASPMRANVGGLVGIWDSLDGVLAVSGITIPDNVGMRHRYGQLPITHEIGHLLGQHHIGALKKTALCMRLADKNAPPTIIAGTGPVEEGRENSPECYGYGEMPSLANNIMGYGMAFDSVNAKPWKDRIALHTGIESQAWTVSTKDVPPLRYSASPHKNKK